MEFYLKYQGPLKSNASPQEKHMLRKHFHKQLKSFFSLDQSLQARKNWKVETMSDEKEINCIVQKNDFYFAPLISSKLHLLAEIDITLLWPDRPGQIIGNGDIDNKLKTLLDALSCPSNDNQLVEMSPDNEETPFYCLLEDDKLIQNLNIRTHTLLEHTHDNELFVLIHAQSKATAIIWDNIGL